MADNVVCCDVAIGVYTQGPNMTCYGSALIRCRCNPSGVLHVSGRQGHGQTTLAVSEVLALIYALQLAQFMRCANIRLFDSLLSFGLHDVIDFREPRAPETDDSDHQHQGYMLFLDSAAIALLNSFESIVSEHVVIWAANDTAFQASQFNLEEGRQANILLIFPN